MGGHRRWAVVALALAVAGVSAMPIVRLVLWRWEQNPILRGRQVAKAAACFHCHLPEARKEIPNPGSRWGTVPAFASGNAFMYGPTREEIEGFIRFGAPADWLQDPKVVERLRSQRLRMPAYEGRLAEDEIADLVTFVAVLEGVDKPADPVAAAGRDLARSLGCTSCHGIGGSGGLVNEGSLGGFVPGFLGRNFSHLVEDREEFDQWVLDGASRRFRANPLANFFWERQEIQMPGFRGELTEEQLDLLWSWIQAARETYAEGG